MKMAAKKTAAKKMGSSNSKMDKMSKKEMGATAKNAFMKMMMMKKKK
jgi:hypothetical protein